MKLLKFLVYALVGVATAGEAAAQTWILDGGASKIAYGSIKRNSIGEVNHFRSLTGTVTGDGRVEVDIDLASVETWIDLRNERMRDIVFAGIERRARLSSRIDMSKVSQLAPGDGVRIETQGSLTFGSRSLQFDVPIYVVRLSQSRVAAMTDEMVMLQTDKLGIEPAIDKLAEIMGLPSITRAVPVTFRLMFDASGSVAAAAPNVAVHAAAPADSARGRAVFRRCAACHSVDGSANAAGPTLKGVLGRSVASGADYNFSGALRGVGGVWTEASLREFLREPRKFAPGNRMAFNGLRDAGEIEAVIAYLKEGS